MAGATISDESGAGRSAQIGFWLGLLLFAALLVAPTPRSMRVAVRTCFATEIQREVERQAAASSTADTPAAAREAAVARDSGLPGATRDSLEAQCVERRARRLLAAAAVTALVACWWITLALPIPATSLLPLTLFPLVGVMSVKEAAAPYANTNVFLFMGGFVIALGIERWGLHRRIALHVVRIVGTGRATLVLGFMIATAALSMWISNTATAMMMLPIGLAVIRALEQLVPQSAAPARDQANFAAALMLGIAYAASIGGVATPIGTPPNISFRGQFSQLFPAGPEISFGQWLVAFLPLAALFIPIAWLVLTRITCPVGGGGASAGRAVVRAELRQLGRLAGAERTMLLIAGATAALWMTREIPLGAADYGWTRGVAALLRVAAPNAPFDPDLVNDASVAMLMAVLLFMIPAERVSRGRAPRLMDWATASRLPWGVLLLFGGGFSLAAAAQQTGLSYWIGQVMADWTPRSPVVMVGATATLLTFLTELTSNTATTEVMLPILANLSAQLGADPRMLMLPATISASFAFMLPVATPPNAIVFGSGRVGMGDMIRSGIILNVIGIGLVLLAMKVFAGPLLGVRFDAAPAWAQ